MKILVDGDLLIYRAGFGAQSRGSDVPVSHSLHNLDSMLKSYVKYLDKFFNIKGVRVYITNDKKDNFRFDIAHTFEYKGNRKDLEKPKHFKEMREYLLRKYKAVEVFGQEADDAMGIEAARDPESFLIASADKDMNMIPGWHWKMDTAEKPFFADKSGHLQLIRMSGKKSKLVGTGLKWFFAQCLLGDRVDNIPGLNGYGDVKVYKLLCHVPVDGLYSLVEAEYKKKGLSPGDLHERARMLWIRQEQGELWSPK